MKTPTDYHRALYAPDAALPAARPDGQACLLMPGVPLTPAESSQTQIEYDGLVLRSAPGSDAGARDRYPRKPDDRPHRHGESSLPSGQECLFCRMPYQGLEMQLPNATCARCGSPLYVPARQGPQEGCRRAARRLVRHGELVIYQSWPLDAGQRGQMRDVSPHGMQFLTMTQLERTQIIRIVGGSVSAIARVRHMCAPRGPAHVHVVGVEFCTIRYSSSRGSFFSSSA